MRQDQYHSRGETQRPYQPRPMHDVEKVAKSRTACARDSAVVSEDRVISADHIDADPMEEILFQAGLRLVGHNARRCQALTRRRVPQYGRRSSKHRMWVQVKLSPP